jgi:hypothetical protein
MNDEVVEVDAYSGYKGDERPLSFLFNGVCIRVERIVAMWVDQDVANGEQRRFFRVEGSDGRLYTLYLAEGDMRWHRCS